MSYYMQNESGLTITPFSPEIGSLRMISGEINKLYSTLHIFKNKFN